MSDAKNVGKNLQKKLSGKLDDPKKKENLNQKEEKK